MDWIVTLRMTFCKVSMLIGLSRDGLMEYHYGKRDIFQYLKFCQMSKKINKYNFSYLSRFQWEENLFAQLA